METGLQLLMRDGAACVRFQPRLTGEQYAELLERVERATTRDELRREMEDAARQWGKQLAFDTQLE
jgi:UDP-N-acetylglucosamine:LPS N-acetylglucosamine transferase